MAYRYATVILTIECSEPIDSQGKETDLLDDIKSTVQDKSELVGQVFSVDVRPANPEAALF